MLAEAFILRLEATLRNTDALTNQSSDRRFVPIALAVSVPKNQQSSSTQKN
jgi:hypothetical protein